MSSCSCCVDTEHAITDLPFVTERKRFPRVELRGHEIDLQNLVAVLGAGDHRVSVEGKIYWLRSVDFDGLDDDPVQARAKASKLLPLINAAAKALIPGFNPVELGQCVDWLSPGGRPKRRLTATLPVYVRSSERVSGSEEGATLADEMSRWTVLARRDETVAEVLSLWGSVSVHGWSTLYKIVEKIHAAAGARIAEHRWVSKSELRRFNHTANSPAAVGRAARHGVQKTEPPVNPMTITEAEELVRHLIRAWLGDIKMSAQTD